MDPIAFRIFGIEVAWYGIIISIGMFFGIIVAISRAKKEKMSEDVILDLVLIAIPAAVVGARLYYVIFKWDYYAQNLSHVFQIRSGGLAIHGGVMAGVLAGYFFCKYKKISFWKLADICAPSIILGQAIGRWGNYFNQEAFGTPTDLPWAIEIDGMMVHPTFLYESIWNFGVFGFLLYYTIKKKFQGEIFLYYLILYSVGRFFIEGLRTDSLMIGPLRTAQVISIATILGALILMKALKNNENT